MPLATDIASIGKTQRQPICSTGAIHGGRQGINIAGLGNEGQEGVGRSGGTAYGSFGSISTPKTIGNPSVVAGGVRILAIQIGDIGEVILVDRAYYRRDYLHGSTDTIRAAEGIRDDYPVAGGIRRLQVGQCQHQIGRIGNVIGILLPLIGEWITAAYRNSQGLVFPDKIGSTYRLRGDER
jgi:hypothetical protein